MDLSNLPVGTVILIEKQERTIVDVAHHIDTDGEPYTEYLFNEEFEVFGEMTKICYDDELYIFTDIYEVIGEDND